jgi:hypothetical protein
MTIVTKNRDTVFQIGRKKTIEIARKGEYFRIVCYRGREQGGIGKLKNREDLRERKVSGVKGKHFTAVIAISSLLGRHHQP